MKKILMIGTGGTIACKQTDSGLTPGLTAEDVLAYIPAVEKVCQVETIQVMNIDSSNMTPVLWKDIVNAIEENYANYDGFVVCHGTDTLAYTAAALSYMIQNSAKPIVVTGSQKPISKDVTDAKTNLLDSFIYASDDESQNVSIVFDGKVICGTRAKKERAKSYNAFSSINFPYLAVIQDGIIIRYIPEVPVRGIPSFYYDMSDKVTLLKLYPGMKPDVLSYLFENYDIVVIESFGVGGMPETLMETFYEEMEKWKGTDKLAVMTTQVANEGSNMTIYEVGRQVKQDFHMIESYDMTLEATMTKLMWLRSMNYSNKRLREAFYTEINRDILFRKN
ncbi:MULTISPECIES: asparaginase [Pseudobutyrivibrio]|uniref:asparaginase n=1 Tax=Pseudobutyrivibrio xylanivorans TaxID=185007 RepID=A0A1G5RQQ2_PSEXY|nr:MULTISPECIES: asparaginase [Pseudobutyrivibrio]MDC7280261.1 asparaginase [Butyrivibrio fibrisolvens]SCZ76413.1 L-asparaginase [Pseudobutyrivibrio xylanivorans]